MAARGIRDVAIERLREGLEPIAGKRILDVGAGAGRVAARLAEAGADVTALDFTLPHEPPPGVSFVAHDLNQGALPFETGTFDAVVSTEVFEHLRSPFFALASMVRVLRPGGLLVLTMPNYWNVRYRVKYLLTGHLQRPFVDDARKRALYLEGRAPHINAMPFPVLHALLTWEGCGDIELRAARPFAFTRRLLYLPVLAAIRLTTWAAGPERRRRFVLDHTNSRAALLGRRHVLIAARKRRET